jgi:hypothetical protein
MIHGFDVSSLAPMPNQGDSAGTIPIAMTIRGGFCVSTMGFYTVHCACRMLKAGQVPRSRLIVIWPTTETIDAEISSKPMMVL